LLTAERSDYAGEFLCEVTREGNRDEMTVLAEVRAAATDVLRDEYEALLRARLGVEMRVRLCAPGALAERTGVESRQKPVRLFDLRKG
jgi:phenylacetate-coenzyme A ligase PaaK-like adenylate-forming protein